MVPGFPVGNIVPGSDLVGRENLIRSLANRLERGENLILASPRRTGKTSVAMELLARLQGSRRGPGFGGRAGPGTRPKGG